MHKIFIKADRPCSGQLQIMGARSESMTNYRRLISYIYAYEGEVKERILGLPSWNPGMGNANSA